MDTTVCFRADDGRVGFGETSGAALRQCLGTAEAQAVLDAAAEQGDYFSTQEFVDAGDQVICYHERSNLTVSGQRIGAFLAFP